MTYRIAHFTFEHVKRSSYDNERWQKHVNHQSSVDHRFFCVTRRLVQHIVVNLQMRRWHINDNIKVTSNCFWSQHLLNFPTGVNVALLTPISIFSNGSVWIGPSLSANRSAILAGGKNASYDLQFAWLRNTVNLITRGTTECTAAEYTTSLSTCERKPAVQSGDVCFGFGTHDSLKLPEGRFSDAAVSKLRRKDDYSEERVIIISDCKRIISDCSQLEATTWDATAKRLKKRAELVMASTKRQVLYLQSE